MKRLLRSGSLAREASGPASSALFPREPERRLATINGRQTGALLIARPSWLVRNQVPGTADCQGPCVPGTGRVPETTNKGQPALPPALPGWTRAPGKSRHRVACRVLRNILPRSGCSTQASVSVAPRVNAPAQGRRRWAATMGKPGPLFPPFADRAFSHAQSGGGGVQADTTAGA